MKTTPQLEAKIKAHNEKIDAIINKLTSLGNSVNLQELEQLKANFNNKVTDFFREGRKLNIGVMGQVKAGKSSFLNTLLFEGQPILPKASTPKTATLTKIEYAEQNSMEIEYYTADEWNSLMHKLKDDADTNTERSAYAKELFNLYNDIPGEQIADKLELGREKLLFDDYEQLAGKLNEYVGENGLYTPVVKAVILYIDKPELQGVSIVDTPGLSDPIMSRTTRTKEFMEICDIVFLLSQATEFLNSSDWQLLATQLPDKGVKRIVLISSKFDSALLGVLKKTELSSDNPFDDLDDSEEQNTAANIGDAIEIIRKGCLAHSQKQIKKHIETLRLRHRDEELIAIIEQCQEPILVSALAYNMLHKDKAAYDAEEQVIYNNLANFFEDELQDLKQIANFEEVLIIFNQAVAAKDNVLLEQLNSMLPAAEKKLAQTLLKLTASTEQTLNCLKNSEQKDLAAQKDSISRQLNNIQANISAVLGQVLNKLAGTKNETISDLRQTSNNYINLQTKTGTETVRESYQVSTSRWYNPFSWGTYRTEFHTYDKKYSYIDASDALNNIHRYGQNVQAGLQGIFAKATSSADLKKSLLTVIVNNFEMSQTKYDPNHFRNIIETTLNNITIPHIKIDFREEEDLIATKFSGEIISSGEISDLRRSLTEAISKLTDIAIDNATAECDKFKIMLEDLMQNLSKELLQGIHQEFDRILGLYTAKEANILTLEKQLQYLKEVQE